MAATAAHDTMLQRPPTFFRTGRNAIEIAEVLRRLQVDETWVHDITRRKILLEQEVFTRMCFEQPDKVRADLLANVRSLLGPDPVFDHDFVHHKPANDPFGQYLHQDALVAPTLASDVQLFYLPHEAAPDGGGPGFVPGTHLRRVHETDVGRLKRLLPHL